MSTSLDQPSFQWCDYRFMMIKGFLYPLVSVLMNGTCGRHSAAKAGWCPWSVADDSVPENRNEIDRIDHEDMLHSHSAYLRVHEI